jgi:hypothetical protein
MLLVISNLKGNRQAIVDLIGNNYEMIIYQIVNMSNIDRRIGLLKVFINLILEASEHLSYHKDLFTQIFDLIKEKDVDELMIENVLWFSTSLCEQKLFNINFHLILE